MAFARVTTLWQLYLVQAAGISIGMSGQFACVMSTVAKWHEARRGLATGIASAGIGISSIIYPPVATKLIETNGWEFAIFVIGVIILAIGIPTSLMMRDPPNPVKGRLSSGGSASRGPFDAWVLLPRFLRNPAFLPVFLLFLLIETVAIMLINHLVNYATDIGITALAAAGMMSAMGLASVTGRLGIGAISDRIGSKRHAAVCCVLIAMSLVLLISRMPALMWVAAVLFGIGMGGAAPLVPALIGERVSIEHLSTAIGICAMGMSIGAALGPWLGGVIFDISGSYLWALLLAAGATAVALIIALRLRPARQEIPIQKNLLAEFKK